MLGPRMDSGMMTVHKAMAPMMNQMGARHDQMMSEIAARFGVTRAELETALADGKSLAQPAEEQKVAPDEIQRLMVRSIKAFLDKALEDGTLTEDQANQIFQFHQQHGATASPAGASGRWAVPL